MKICGGGVKSSRRRGVVAAAAAKHQQHGKSWRSLAHLEKPLKA
jgi:hypothetical protein